MTSEQQPPPATKAEASEILTLARSLFSERKFVEAHKLLHEYGEEHVLSALDRKLYDEFVFAHAGALYRDVELPSDYVLRETLTLLEQEMDLSNTQHPDVLLLAGRLFMRMWSLDGQWHHLRQALHFFSLAFEAADRSTTDRIEAGINTAFTLDVLARQEEIAVFTAQSAPDFSVSVPTIDQQRASEWGRVAGSHRSQADDIRTQLLAEIDEVLTHRADEWRPLVWKAEALFGAERYEEAIDLLRRIHSLKSQPDDVDQQEIAKRLVELSRIHGYRPEVQRNDKADQAWNAVRAFLHDIDPDAVDTIFTGKVGLALSGGGFRAALFHVGVLAKLSERDILRHVEVLSCVSGGSIVGTYYYLQLQKLLESKRDDELTAQDYVDCVELTRKNLLEGIQRNVRSRVFTNLIANLKMVTRYSPSVRLGELLEREIFSLVDRKEEKDESLRERSLRRRTKRYLRMLWINPAGVERDTFRPHHDNWRRKHKVPILILNATTLNTGHNWQFTGSHMGEPTTRIDPDVDANARLERIRFDRDRPKHRRQIAQDEIVFQAERALRKRTVRQISADEQPVRLGTAVAASAAVPGLFEPVLLEDRYRYQGVDWRVRLSDGGVHDNQGIGGLLEQGCNVLFVSDATGQLSSSESPPGGLLPALRSNVILMERVRASQYDDLATRRRTGLIRDFAYIHLKRDLRGPVIEALGDQEDRQQAHRITEGPNTSYQVCKNVQRRLAEIRTDLDSFTNIEADALMASAYAMTEEVLSQGIGPFQPDKTSDQKHPTKTPEEAEDIGQPAWKFLRIRPLLEHNAPSPEHEDLCQLLKAGRHRAFKIAQMTTLGIWLKLIIGFVGFSSILLFVTTGLFGWPVSWGIPSQVFALPVLIIVGLMVLGLLVGIKARPGGIAWKLFLVLIPGIIGFVLLNLHLLTTDRLFLHKGKTDRLLRGTPTSDRQTKTRTGPDNNAT